MRSPWKGGSIALRRERCSLPSSRSTEREPITGSSAKLRPGGRPFSRLRYSALIEAGSEIITIGV